MRSIYDAAAALQVRGPREQPTRCDSLEDLVGNYEQGLLALRNLKKVLNHLDLVRQYDSIARGLGLHPVAGNHELYQQNWSLLAAHQAGKTTTADAIRELTSNGRQHGVALTEASVRQQLRVLHRVAHCELHPTDLCNLSCRGCTYLGDTAQTAMTRETFPLAGVDRLAPMKPRSILITGGGEPLLYRSGPSRFPDLVERLRRSLPECRLALVSNGTSLPEGSWPQALDWVRFSVDAATPQTYARCRGTDWFSRVANNVLRFLTTTTVPHVGIGFLYSADNIHEAADVVEYFYQRIQAECPKQLHRFNVQYRPLRQDREDVGREFPGAISEQQIRSAESAFVALARRHQGLADFLRNQTNCEVVLGGNRHCSLDFGVCHYSLIFQVVRPDGTIRPCFVRVFEPEFLIGNIFDDTLESIGLNRVHNAMYLRPGCSPTGCRQCHLNWMLAKGLAGETEPSHAETVVQSPFF
jgi:radical SAM protein with 4Fe4S-binding SPASM domain